MLVRQVHRFRSLRAPPFHFLLFAFLLFAFVTISHLSIRTLESTAKPESEIEIVNQRQQPQTKVPTHKEFEVEEVEEEVDDAPSDDVGRPWEDRVLRRFWDLLKRNGTKTASLFHAPEMKKLWGPVEGQSALSSESGITRWIPQLVWGMEAKLQGLDRKPKKTILVWDSWAWWWHPDYSRTMPASKMGCDATEGLTLTNCDFTRDWDTWRRGEVDAVVTSSMNSDRSAGGLPETALRFIYNLESPSNSHFKTKREMDLLATYWRGSDVVTSYSFWARKDPRVKVKVKEMERSYARGKSKPVAAFISNCNDRNGRLAYVRELKKHIPVHVYGKCGSKICRRGGKECFAMLKKDYYFVLAFENSNCRDYVTEKLFLNGLKNDVVPIVMGAHPDDYAALAPNHSYIHVEDYKSPKALAKELKRLISNPAEYDAYFAWKGSMEFVPNSFFCQICAMVHYADVVPPPKRKVPFGWVEGGGMCLPKGQWFWGRPNGNEGLAIGETFK